jgi:predicted TIM-barrel fold metal-dependent hydrolase
MEEIRGIDMMNYPDAAGFDKEFIFDFKEYQVMCSGTFKTIFKGHIPNREEYKKIRDQGFMKINASPEELVAEMDAAGFDYVVLSDMKMWSPRYHHQLIYGADMTVDILGEIVARGRGRIIGGAGYNPFKISESLRDIERGVKEYGFKYAYMHPITFGIAANDKKCYPLYAKCMDLGISVGMQVGHSAEPLPSDVGRPMYVDEVAIDFPDLKINLSHTGYPWIDEWCSMLWRHNNVYGDISAYNPAHLEPATINFIKGRGQDKVMFGTNGFGLGSMKNAFLSLDIKDSIRKKVLRDNALVFLGL